MSSSSSREVQQDGEGSGRKKRSAIGNPYAESNAIVQELAAAHRFRTRRNGDGELVVRTWADRKKVAYWSREGDDCWGLVILGHSRPSRSVRALQRFAPGLKDRCTESDLYVAVTEVEAFRIMKQGPRWARARVQKVLSPEAGEKALLNLRGK